MCMGASVCLRLCVRGCMCVHARVRMYIKNIYVCVCMINVCACACVLLLDGFYFLQ